VENDAEAAEIVKSLKKDFGGADSLTLSFKKSRKTFSYSFRGKDGLVLEK